MSKSEGIWESTVAYLNQNIQWKAELMLKQAGEKVDQYVFQTKPFIPNYQYQCDQEAYFATSELKDALVWTVKIVGRMTDPKTDEKNVWIIELTPEDAQTYAKNFWKEPMRCLAVMEDYLKPVCNNPK